MYIEQPKTDTQSQLIWLLKLPACNIRYIITSFANKIDHKVRSRNPIQIALCATLSETPENNSSSFLPVNETFPSPLPMPPAPREEYRSEEDDVPVAPPLADTDAAAEDCAETAAVSECREPSSLSPSLPIWGFS